MLESYPSDKNKIRDGMQHLILCEGKDAFNFLVNYLNSNAFSEQPELSRIVQVEDFGGNSELPSKLLLWSKAPGFQNLKSLVIIRDAETSADSAVNSITSAFDATGIPAPGNPHQFVNEGNLKTGFLLFPECSSELVEGTLEDLCLSIVKDSESVVISEIEAFLISLEVQRIRSFPRRFKTQLHTYFSITDRYVSFKIGEAAKAGAFDWNSPKLDSIKEFLIEMVQ